MNMVLAFSILLTVLAAWGLWSMRSSPAFDDDARRYMIDDITSSESLQHWSQIYRSNHLQQRISFLQFMRNPKGYLRDMLLRTDLVDPFHVEPLLPAQKLVYERVLLAELQAEEAERHQQEQMRQLQRRYAEIGNSDGHHFAPIRKPRLAKRWKTGGFQLIHKPA